MTQKFCLKWNDFDSNVSKSFGLLRNEEYLHDVTIVGDDNNQVSAHKLVLSSCSEYFKNIFKNNKGSHPILCIDGISLGDIGNIMDYMYHGEVSIFQDDMNRFLGIAQRLQLNGIIENDNATERPREYENIKEETEEQKHELTSLSQDEIQHNNSNDPSQPQHKRRVRTIAVNSEDNLAEFREYKRRVRTVAVTNEDNVAVDVKANEYVETLADGSLKCAICGKTASQSNMKQNVRQNMKNHVESHLDGFSFPCEFCGKTYKTRNALSCHRYGHHKSSSK